MLLAQVVHDDMTRGHHLLPRHGDAVARQAVEIDLLALRGIVREEVVFPPRSFHGSEERLRAREEVLPEVDGAVHVEDEAADV